MIETDHMNFWDVLKRNPISFFAVLCIAALGVFLGYMVVWHTNTLASEAWCSKAIMAEKISPGTSFVGLVACKDMLLLQLRAMALNSHILFGSYSFMIIVLMVVVVARAKASAQLPGGISFNVAGNGQGEIKAAEKVADAAVQEAADVKADVNAGVTATPSVSPKPNPNYTGPAMPEPPPRST